MAEGGFNLDTYSHVLIAGQQDFDDYDEGDLSETPELGYTDEQVAAEVAKLTEEDRDLYQQIKTFTDTFYCRHGYIVPLGDLVKMHMTGRFPEIPTQSKEMKQEVREELLREIRKREASK